MKIRLWFRGPVVGSEVDEVIDCEEWGIDPDSENFEEAVEESVRDWAANLYEFGWSPADD